MLRELSAILILCATLQCACADWRDYPFRDDSFNVRAKYGEDVVLHCNDSRVDFEYSVTKWITPTLDILKANQSKTDETLDGQARWDVSEDGIMIFVTLAQEQHFGIYYCEVLRDGIEDGENPEFIVKTALNYKGPYWGDTWPKYEVAAIASICSSLGVAVLFGLAGLIYAFRYTSEDDNKPIGEMDRYLLDENEADDVINTSETEASSPASTSQLTQAYDNKAFQAEGNLYTDPQKNGMVIAMKNEEKDENTDF